MTIGVAAKFPGGLVIGSDSRLTSTAGDPPNDAVPKAFELNFKGRKIAFAVAGDLSVDVLVGQPQEVKSVINCVALLRCALEHPRREADAKTTIRECVSALQAVAAAISYNTAGDLEVLLGEIGRTGPSLWLIRKIRGLGKPSPPEIVNDGPPVMGTGQFVTYKRLATTSSISLNPEQRGRIKSSPPPPYPSAAFPDRAAAEAWVRDVINWCVGQFPDCGGAANVFVLP